ncbi:MAG: dihydroorotate dehydrogenase B catalytic subunit [Planctomycetes bacterium]|nr:dihydroorotate dehydrogenase B catalytic subunit [Planctomycetota bacterium]
MRAGLLRTSLLPGLTLANPVLSASGCYNHGVEGARFGDVKRLGALVTKTVTPRPRAGNPPPRLWETSAGMLNSIGLENPGVERFLAEEMPRALELGPPVILNVGGESLEEFEQVTERVQDCGAVALEVNLSCPNVQGGQLPFATSPAACEEVVGRVRRVSRLPFFVKLSPNTHLVADVARAAASAGADGLTLINTLHGRGIDWRRRRPCLAEGSGGLSGPAIKPVALHFVALVRAAVRLPILGVGGIATAEDVCEFLVAGASAVQVGTAHFLDPLCGVHIVEELEELLVAEGESIDNLSSLEQ